MMFYDMGFWCYDVFFLIFVCEFDHDLMGYRMSTSKELTDSCGLHPSNLSLTLMEGNFIVPTKERYSFSFEVKDKCYKLKRLA